MYLGFWRYDNTEVINVARTMAYIEAGFGSPAFDFDFPVAYDGLADALGATYRTPVLDAAPWYDEARPETYGFAGVLPMALTGITGSTAAREVVENVGDGGVAQQMRRSSRVIAGSALLVGDSAASVYAGLDWFTTVLLRQCADVSYQAVLEGFVVMPEGYDGLEDLDADLVTTTISPTADNWAGYGGTWDGATHTFAVEPQPQDPLTSVDGGHPGTTSSEVSDGGAPDGTGGSGPDVDGNTAGNFDGGDVTGTHYVHSVDGGGPHVADVAQRLDGGETPGRTSVPYARLVPPVDLGCLSLVTVTWTVDAIAGATTPLIVQVGAVDSLGRELDRDLTLHTFAPSDAAATIVKTWQNTPWEDWSPALWVNTPGAVVTVTVSKRPLLDPDLCLSPLRRTFYDLDCVAAPSVVNEYADECDNKLLQIEWTWLAGNAYRYGDLTDLVVALPVTAAGDGERHAEGVELDYLGSVANAGLACAAPSTVPPTCAYDPSYPGFVAPPAAPVIADPGAVNHTNVKRKLISVDPGVLPEHGVVALWWAFTNDGTAKHSVRVRLWQQDDPDFTTHTECDFVDEFWINYIAPNATFYINGLGDEVNAVCDGAVVPAGGVLRGAYRGTFDPPVIACGGRYFITVDTGATEGALTMSLSAAPREG